MGGLDDKVSEGLLWELFVQAGPVVNVHMPKDRVTQQHQGYGFVEFMGEDDADYGIKIMNMIKVRIFLFLKLFYISPYVLFCIIFFTLIIM